MHVNFRILLCSFFSSPPTTTSKIDEFAKLNCFLKVVANEDTMLRTHCYGHKCFPVCPCAQHLLRTQNLCPRHKKRFLIFVRNILCPQQMFPRLRGMDTKQMFCVPLVCPPKKHHEQQCVGNNVSSFATTLTLGKLITKFSCCISEKFMYMS